MLHGLDNTAHPASAWNHPERINPPFQFPFISSSTPHSRLVLPPYAAFRLLCQIHWVWFLACYSESCKGNLEGLSGINLKRMLLSLLLFLALLAGWFCSSGLQAFDLTSFPHSPPPCYWCSKFLSELISKKKKSLLHFLRNDPLSLRLWDSETKFYTHRMALFEDGVGSPGSCEVKKFDGSWGGHEVWWSLGWFKAKLLWGLGLLRVQM